MGSEIYISEKRNRTMQVIGMSATIFDALGNKMIFHNGRLKYIRAADPIFGEIRVNYCQSGGLDTDKIDAVTYHKYYYNPPYDPYEPFPSYKIEYIYTSNNVSQIISSYRNSDDSDNDKRDPDDGMVEISKKYFEYNSGNIIEVKTLQMKTVLLLGITIQKYALSLIIRVKVYLYLMIVITL